MDAGETLFFSHSEHLWVVISDPAQDKDRVLLVNFSSVKVGVPFDSACELSPGDHSFITKQTFVYYRHAQVLPNRDLESQVSSGRIKISRHGPVSEDTIAYDSLS